MPVPNPQTVTELFAFVALNPDGTEGVVAGRQPSGAVVPLIANTLEHAQALIPTAQSIANLGSFDIELVRFARAEHVMDVRAGEAPGDEASMRDPALQTHLTIDQSPPLDAKLRIKGLGEHPE